MFHLHLSLIRHMKYTKNQTTNKATANIVLKAEFNHYCYIL